MAKKYKQLELVSENGNGKRQTNPRSLENLKLGAEARNQGKVRLNVTLLPETIQWLKARGNASFLIDSLVASARSEAIKCSSDNSLDQCEEVRSENNNDK